MTVLSRLRPSVSGFLFQGELAGGSRGGSRDGSFTVTTIYDYTVVPLLVSVREHNRALSKGDMVLCLLEKRAVRPVTFSREVVGRPLRSALTATRPTTSRTRSDASYLVWFRVRSESGGCLTEGQAHRQFLPFNPSLPRAWVIRVPTAHDNVRRSLIDPSWA